MSKNPNKISQKIKNVNKEIFIKELRKTFNENGDISVFLK